MISLFTFIIKGLLGEHGAFGRPSGPGLRLGAQCHERAAAAEPLRGQRAARERAHGLAPGRYDLDVEI